MIEDDLCQIDSDFNTHARTESSLGTPGPDVEGLVLILSGPNTYFSKSSSLGSSVNTGFMKGLRSIASLGLCFGGYSLSGSAQLYLHHESDPVGKNWWSCFSSLDKEGTQHRLLCTFNPRPRENLEWLLRRRPLDYR